MTCDIVQRQEEMNKGGERFKTFSCLTIILLRPELFH